MHLAVPSRGTNNHCEAGGYMESYLVGADGAEIASGYREFGYFCQLAQFMTFRAG